MSAADSDVPPIVVAGDVCIDWLAWPQPAVRDIRGANWRQLDGTRMVARRGGALLLTDFLKKATKREVISPSVANIEVKGPNDYLHSLVDLEPVTEDPPRFRIARLRGFSGPAKGDPRPPDVDVENRGAAVVVLDDSGNGFRKTEAAWKKLVDEGHPQWLVVKMSSPLAVGPMWEHVRHGPLGRGGEPDPERLIVVVNADDLRAEKIALSRRLSWERTAEDFSRELGSNGQLASLVTCAHLIVRFDCDGVIHHQGRSGAAPELYFDPARAEGEFVESTEVRRMMGMTDAFTAALAAELAEHDGAIDGVMERAVIRGMTAARRLAAAGFDVEDGAPIYPHAHAMAATAPDSLSRLSIPSKRVAAGESWSILHDRLGDATDAARRVVKEGPQSALVEVPLARFGELETADRGEIESYRAIGNLLRDYLHRPQTKPISIAVFGPPGAGKSFGVQQVAEYAKSGRSGKTKNGKVAEAETPLEFNLSQFTKLDDLIAAFHLVRDRALSGVVPLVFFDEFDSDFEGNELGWLRYFLAPMQDGRFREASHTHPLGAAIFVFAGGTRRSLKEFVEPMTKQKDDPAYMKFAAVKGPDFASRLRGHVDIRGPNPVDASDLTFPIRRAFLLRSMFDRREKLLKAGQGYNIDDGVLHALLTVPVYRHGTRSMEALLAMSALTGRRQFERAALPPTEQLESHVDAADFMARVKGERLDDELRDKLGRLLHEVYRAQRKAIAENDSERAALADDEAMREWRYLDEVFRESSRLQADDIPRKLRQINCYMAQETADTDAAMPPAVTAFTPEEIDELSKMEHDRYNAERLRQWRLGERDPAKQTSPSLVPWSDLDPKWRSLDESAVKAIPSVLAKVGRRVYRKNS